MKSRWVKILLDAGGGDGGSGGGGNGGGSSNGGNGAGDLAVQELRRLKAKYDELKKERDDLFVKMTQTEKDRDKLVSENETISKQLGTFTAEKARKEHLATLLSHRDFKGLTVDSDKVMKFLSRGDFDEKALDTEVREAIALFGEKAAPAGNTIDPRGAGNENETGNRSTENNSDFIGSFVARSMGKA